MEPQGIPVKVDRRTLYAVYSERESSQPNALPTYRLYTADGTYVMNYLQWQVDSHRIQKEEAL